MKKPKLGGRVGSPTWIAYSASLSTEVLAELQGHLGSATGDAGDVWVLDVHFWLGFYPGGVRALDNAPRASDYAKQYGHIRKLTGTLINELAELSEFYREKYNTRDALGKRGFEETLQHLAKLFDVTRALERQHENRKSDGRPKGSALHVLILNLRAIFRNHYQGPVIPRRKLGARTVLPEWEIREREFVRTALTGAGIPASNLLELLSDQRCQPSVVTPVSRKGKSNPNGG